ncbi:unnamed protein product [Discula destructiva]
MGKPSTLPASPPGDLISLHTQPERPIYDNDAPELDIPEDNDDLPPLYDEAAEANTSHAAPLLSAPIYSANSVVGTSQTTLQPFRRDEHISYYLDSNLDSNPEVLEGHVRVWAATPPRPFVYIKGTHRETRSNRDGKRESKAITDFDIKVELTPYFCPDGGLSRTGCELRTAENGDLTRRGTVLRHRAAAAKGGNAGRIELGRVEKPSLAQWCHMYCASHAGLKVFQVRRSLSGFDEARVRDHLDGLVRRLNYRGHLQITFPVRDERVEVWSDCRTNRWRLTTWIFAMFCVSMLWVVLWPCLFFRTKRFEAVSAVWNYSTIDNDGRRRYTTISEDQWYNLWGRAISKAVLSKRQAVLDQQDLLAAESHPPSLNTGNAAVDGGLGLVLAGVNAMNEVNRHLGWGEDQ